MSFLNFISYLSLTFHCILSCSFTFPSFLKMLSFTFFPFPFIFDLFLFSFFSLLLRVLEFSHHTCSFIFSPHLPCHLHSRPVCLSPNNKRTLIAMRILLSILTRFFPFHIQSALASITERKMFKNGKAKYCLGERGERNWESRRGRKVGNVSEYILCFSLFLSSDFHFSSLPFVLVPFHIFPSLFSFLNKISEERNLLLCKRERKRERREEIGKERKDDNHKRYIIRGKKNEYINWM